MPVLRCPAIADACPPSKSSLLPTRSLSITSAFLPSEHCAQLCTVFTMPTVNWVLLGIWRVHQGGRLVAALQLACRRTLPTRQEKRVIVAIMILIIMLCTLCCAGDHLMREEAHAAARIHRRRYPRPDRDIHLVGLRSNHHRGIRVILPNCHRLCHRHSALLCAADLHDQHAAGGKSPFLFFCALSAPLLAPLLLPIWKRNICAILLDTPVLGRCLPNRPSCPNRHHQQTFMSNMLQVCGLSLCFRVVSCAKRRTVWLLGPLGCFFTLTTVCSGYLSSEGAECQGPMPT